MLGGAILGAFVEASAGAWTGDPWAGAIGAAIGGGLGLIAVLAGAGYRWANPDKAYDDFVENCLTEKGYEVSGWE